MGVVKGIGLLLMAVGLMAGSVALSMWLVGAHRGRLASRLRKAPLLTCQEVAAAKFLPQRVVIAGRVAPGPTGPVRAPVSNRQCAWYRVDISGRTKNVDKDPYTITHRTEGMIAIEDGTGTVLVSARALDRYICTADIGNDYLCEVPQHTLPAKRKYSEVRERLRAAGLWNETYELKAMSFHEMRVDPGRSITVLGTPRRRGELGWTLEAHRGDGSSVRDLETLRADADAERADLLNTMVRPASKAAASLFAVAGALLGIAWLLA